ncbi:MAG: diguanylate cyclase domain-containing protein [Acidimicrobiales bacterium]
MPNQDPELERIAVVPMTMTEDHGSANGAHGGVGHLLRIAKTQCGVSLAFAALRKADGGFAIATFPSLTADPTWTIEAIDELVRQTWDDPHLSGANVLVRSGRVLKGMWTGQSHHIKLAAAALSDPSSPEHPWGLLCVAEPLAGHFEQDQLNLLGNLGTRLTSYLRARQQVLDASPALEATESVPTFALEPQATLESAYEPIVPTPALEPDQPQPPDQVPAEGFEDPADLFAGLGHQIGAPSEEIAPQDLTQPAPSWGSSPWDLRSPDEIEWVETDLSDVQATVTEVPAPAPQTPVDEDAEATAPGPDDALVQDSGGDDTPAQDTATQDSPGEPQTSETPRTTPDTAQDSGVAATTTGIDSLLGPDEVTGLATLPTLVLRLSSSLAHVRNNEGTVGLILVEVAGESHEPGPLAPSALMTVAGRLTNHLRERDLVARIGPSLFAVLVDLRPGAIELEAIRERSLRSLTSGIDSSTGGLRANSAMATASTGSLQSAEELLRTAAQALRT